MIVLNQTIPKEAIDKVTVWACTTIHFTAGELSVQLRRARLDEEVSYRTADRLLQQWKKAAKIIFRKGQWHWQGGIN